MTGGVGALRASRRAARGLVGVAALILVFEAISRSGLVNPVYLPPASSVLLATLGLLVDPEFLVHLGGTVIAWAIGLGLATVVAVPVGVLLGSSWRSYLAATTAIELLRPIPSVALIPLAIILLGRGLDMRVALIAYAASWPILLNAIYGVRDVDPIALDTARSFGLGRAEILWRVSLRSASPFIFTGIRISAGIALILAVSTELIAGGGPGIGTWMLSTSQTGVPRELLFAGIVVSGLLGLAINAVMAATERHLFGWNPRVRGAA